jgi:hypothetical protein
MQPIDTIGALSPWEPGIFSLTIFGVLILVFIASQLFVAHWLGEKKKNAEKLRAYESGVIPTGLMWRRLLFFPGRLRLKNSAGQAGCRYHFSLSS